MNQQISLDALPPAALAQKAEDIGVKKGHLDFLSMFLLAVLAGAFIGMGAIFCTVAVTGGAGALPFGVVKLLGGFVFCLGLILVVVAGAELFTGNNLIIMAVVSGKLPVSKLLRNWIIVYAGNLIGSVATAYIMFLTGQFKFAGGLLGVTALNIAHAKCSIPFMEALTRGIFCNALVCLAVWLTFSARTVAGKIQAILFPITAFVAAGFEHCVANMYFIPVALFIKAGAQGSFWSGAGKTAADYANLTWAKFFVVNLLPVTIGNIIGGAVFVGAVYWVIYLRNAE